MTPNVAASLTIVHNGQNFSDNLVRHALSGTLDCVSGVPILSWLKGLPLSVEAVPNWHKDCSEQAYKITILRFVDPAPFKWLFLVQR